MVDSTSWTPSPESNKLGLIDRDAINEAEAMGIARAELYVFGLDEDVELSIKLILQIHEVAFSELYDWAGEWRKTQVAVGGLVPPQPIQILQLMYQFVDNLRFKVLMAKDKSGHIDCLVYCHYEFIRIHPFIYGNGRTGRILMNLIAMKFGYRPLQLYRRDGDGRKVYIDAMKAADRGDFTKLSDLITEELAPF